MRCLCAAYVCGFYVLSNHTGSNTSELHFIHKMFSGLFLTAHAIGVLLSVHIHVQPVPHALPSLPTNLNVDIRVVSSCYQKSDTDCLHPSQLRFFTDQRRDRLAYLPAATFLKWISQRIFLISSVRDRIASSFLKAPGWASFFIGQACRQQKRVAQVSVDNV